MLKTAPRFGKTAAHGEFAARETVYACASGCRRPSGELVVHRPLSSLLLPGREAGYDLMVFVGLRRFLHHSQREEIRGALAHEHGLSVSAGQISALAKLFVEHLARLHQDRAPRLKEAMRRDGGWPMQADATGEHGRGTLFVVMAGWRRWVLGVWKPATERADLLLPCLRRTAELFGDPCASMSDMGRAVLPALRGLVEERGLDIPVLVCHQHFLADVGKDVLEPPHAALRELFRRFKVRPKLREAVRDLGRKLGASIHEAREAVRSWQAVADEGHRIPSGLEGLAVVRAVGQWTLDCKADAVGLDFPFDRPYLDLYDRCLAALRAVDAFLRSPPDDKAVIRGLKRLRRLLDPAASQASFRQAACRLRRRAALVDELRDVLRLAGAAPPEDETERELEDMRGRLDGWAASLRRRRPRRGPAQDVREAIDVIIEHIDKYGANLWGHAIRLPESAGGGVRVVDRTNMLLEHGFKQLKHGERRRSGRRILTRDLEQLPAGAALVPNLKCQDYLDIVCGGSLDLLPEVFAELDRKEELQRSEGIPSPQEDGLERLLKNAASSLPAEDRKVVRTEEMDRRIRAAAGTRAPRSRT